MTAPWPPPRPPVPPPTPRPPPPPWRKRLRLVALIAATALAIVTVAIYWLVHPSDPDAYTQIDTFLFGEGHRCGEPWWAGVLFLFMLAFPAGAALLVVGVLEEVRRHDWTGASLVLLGVMAMLFSIAAGILYFRVSFATFCD